MKNQMTICICHHKSPKNTSRHTHAQTCTHTATATCSYSFSFEPTKHALNYGHNNKSNNMQYKFSYPHPFTHTQSRCLCVQTCAAIHTHCWRKTCMNSVRNRRIPIMMLIRFSCNETLLFFAHFVVQLATALSCFNPTQKTEYGKGN